ncbi:energy-coupling factor transporter ATPase [Veillonella magna]|uniref:Energy-coupling factor transporter ATP-binding protein EcfA2 n=1 Tax=Veillonella magna TaxID=464322 RepID=A0ABS2GH51_9FIRM|nr:energy-coupling factor transporter ATPase [Veillonella magna]MBM6825187.1 energy-coupling factor transporter ATPase [Veillonella magna]MBM6913481.1 energy-coupling factor transporter ATPase [Veillonella magna]
MSIVLDNISYVYGAHTPYEKKALDGVTLEIHEGEFLGIIGHTGSGKSTLVQHLNGLLHPTSGKVTVNDVDLADKTEEARNMRHTVGMVFQYPEHQLFEETIAKDIAFGPRNLGLSGEEVDERVREAMKFVGLDYDTYAERSPFHLSGGQMRRVAIAGVVALNPSYLILDEPSAGLDPFGREEIFDEIIRLHKEKGITVALVSHNMEDISRMATRLIVLDGGHVILDDEPLTIFMHHREELQKAGVDVPPVSVLMETLKHRGLPVSTEVRNVDDAVMAIEKALKEQEVHHAE